jgi:hypothetical protein
MWSFLGSGIDSPAKELAMRPVLLLLLTLSVSVTLSAQRFQWHSAGGYVGTVNSYEGASDIAKDGIGRFHTFDYASRTQACQGVTVTAHGEPGNYSTFLYTFDDNGVLLRAMVVGEDFRALAIEAGDDGSVYMLGRSARGKLIVGEDTATIRSNANYLIKISAAGALVWSTATFLAPGGSESMLLLHNNKLYVQSGAVSVDQVDTAGITRGTITASHYKSQTAVLQLIFRGAQAFSNGDLLFAAISYGSVAFGSDTLRTRSNTFLHLPLLLIRASENMAVQWYRYPFEGLRNADVKTIPLTVDQGDNIYLGIEVSDTCIVGPDTLINKGSTYSGAVAKLDDQGNGLWGRMWTFGVLPWSVAPRPNGTGVAMVGRVGSTTTIGPFTLAGSSGKALYTLLSADGNVDYATVAITGNYGSTAQAILSDTNGTYLLGGLLNGGDGVPVYSCVNGEKVPGFFLGRISEAPDSVPAPQIQQVGDSLIASPAFTGDIQWFLNEQPIAGATSRAIHIRTNGRYTVRYTYATGCVGTATSVATIITTSSVDDQTALDAIRLTPNPVVDRFVLDAGNRSVTSAEIIDLNGQIVDTWIVGNAVLDRDVRALAPGLYQLLLRCKDGAVRTSFIKW